MVQGENYAFFLKVPTVLCTRITINWSFFFSYRQCADENVTKFNSWSKSISSLTTSGAYYGAYYATLKPLRNTVERYTHIMISSRVAD